MTNSFHIHSNMSSGERFAISLLIGARMPKDYSIAPAILDFAVGGTRYASSGRACARLYLALSGFCVPLRDITFSFDHIRLAWFIRAMIEHAADEWGGTFEGIEAIAAVHSDIFEQAMITRNAWRDADQ